MEQHIRHSSDWLSVSKDTVWRLMSLDAVCRSKELLSDGQHLLHKKVLYMGRVAATKYLETLETLAAARTACRKHLTRLECAQIDDAFQGTDREAVEMAQYLLRNDGLFVGSSAAMNCVGAVKAARMLGPGRTIVTVLCDGGHRHLSKFHNRKYLAQCGLLPEHEGRELAFVL